MRLNEIILKVILYTTLVLSLLAIIAINIIMLINDLQNGNMDFSKATYFLVLFYICFRLILWTIMNTIKSKEE